MIVVTITGKNATVAETAGKTIVPTKGKDIIITMPHIMPVIANVLVFSLFFSLIFGFGIWNAPKLNFLDYITIIQ